MIGKTLTSRGGVPASRKSRVVLTTQPAWALRLARPAPATSHTYVIEKILNQYPHVDPRTVAIHLRYSTFVNVKKHYLYFEVPKAACTQMKELLRLEEVAPPIQLLAGNLMETRRKMFVHARENVPLPALVDLDDEVIERNFIISNLYAEGNRLRAKRNQLRADLQRVSRLHLLGLANFLVGIRRRVRDVLHRETTTH